MCSPETTPAGVYKPSELEAIEKEKEVIRELAKKKRPLPTNAVIYEERKTARMQTSGPAPRQFARISTGSLVPRSTERIQTSSMFHINDNNE